MTPQGNLRRFLFNIMMTLDEQIERELKRNPGLAKLFEEHPERKELYKRKILESEGETWGCAEINPAYCKSCVFAHGAPPFADLPEKAYCEIFQHGKTAGKPPEVYYHGEECEFYIKEK